MGGLHIEMNVMEFLGDILPVADGPQFKSTFNHLSRKTNRWTWSANKSSEIPLIKYLYLVIELEPLSMQLVRSFLEANFELYVQCLGQLALWMFTFDHTSYAR